MDKEQFYATPAYLACKMALLIPKEVKSILEPSAGGGSLTSAVKDHVSGAFVSYCEINEERREKLKRGNYSLGGDFLTCDIKEKFDAVIMNPPFCNAEDHFLKAYSLLKKGGTMVCLVSKETLEGKSKKEQLLLDIIKKHRGKVEEITGAFTQKAALKKSNVTCSLISFQKGKATSAKDFRGNMKDEVKNELSLITNSQENSIQIFNYLQSQVENYNNTIKNYKDMYNSYNKMCLGFPADISREAIPKIINESGFIATLRASCWDSIFEKTELRNYMTTEMQAEFKEQQQQQGMKEFTIDNIRELLATFRRSMTLITNRALEDVFSWFTKYHKENRDHIEGWKTNTAWKVNRKIILPDILEWPYNSEPPKYISCSSKRRLGDIEKALCLMLGIRFDDICYKNNYSTIEIPFRYIDSDDYGVWHDTKFFKVKVYKKRTMHLVFKDEKIWEMFNRAVCEGKMWIGVAA